MCRKLKNFSLLFQCIKQKTHQNSTQTQKYLITIELVKSNINEGINKSIIMSSNNFQIIRLE